MVFAKHHSICTRTSHLLPKMLNDFSEVKFSRTTTTYSFAKSHYSKNLKDIRIAIIQQFEIFWIRTKFQNAL